MSALSRPVVDSDWRLACLTRRPWQRAIPDAAAQGVAVIARGCFGGGLLKPAARSGRNSRRETPKWPTIVACQRLAEENQRALLEMALQFVLGTEAVTTTLLGMRTQTHLTENLRYASAPGLSPAEWDPLRAILPSDPV